MAINIDFPEETDDPCVVCGEPMDLKAVTDDDPLCWRLVSRDPVKWVCSDKCERIYRRLDLSKGP